MTLVPRDADVLRLPSGYVRSLDLAEDVVRTLLAELARHEIGLALAAPQVGVPLRVFVVNPGARGFSERFVFVNPVVERWSRKESVDVESCLTLPPDELYLVKRANAVKVSFDTPTGREEKQYDGIGARIVQHEIDHLDGKLICDVGTRAPAKLVGR